MNRKIENPFLYVEVSEDVYKRQIITRAEPSAIMW